MAAARKKKAALPDLTPEQRAFVAGKRWSRDSFGQVLVVAAGPVRGPVPVGISIAAPRISRERRRALERQSHQQPADSPKGTPDSAPLASQPARIERKLERPLAAAPSRPPPPYYTVGRVELWLRNVELLRQLAESPATSRQHMDPQHKKEGATPASPRGGVKRGGGARSDPMKYADILADLERAAKCLPEGLGRRAVLDRMRSPNSLRAISARLQASYPNTIDAYKGAVAAMSATLEPDAQEPKS